MKPRRYLRRVSPKRRLLLAQYARLRRKFLHRHPLCQWALENYGTKEPATEVHHTRGRAGSLLLDTRFWKAVSHAGHVEIHNNVPFARELGFFCAPGQWNKPPKS